MPAPQNKGKLSLQQLKNIFHCWCHRINHQEFILPEISRLLTDTTVDINLLQDIGDQVRNRDSSLTKAGMCVCAIGELHQEVGSSFACMSRKFKQALS